MAKNIFGVSFVLALAQLFAMLASVLLGRHLSPGDFGEFGLMRTLILFIPPLAIWGQDIAAARYFSQLGVADYRWDKAFAKVMAVSAILVAIGVFIAWLIYQLEPFKIVGLYVASLFFCASLFLSSLLRSQQYYNQAIIMYSGFRGLFLFALLPIYFWVHMTKVHAITAFVGVIVFMGIINLIYTFKVLKRGPQPVPAEMHRTGLLLMGIEASVDVMASLDVLFIPRILGYDALGLYAAAIVPSRIFNILARAAKYVWVPEFGRNKHIPHKKIHLLTAAVGIVLLAVVVIWAEPVLHLLFGGKYDHGASILRILALVGFVRFFYGFSTSLIIGKMSDSAIKFHLGFTIASMIAYFFIMYFSLKIFGVLGAAIALLIVTVIRMVGGYLVVYLFKGTQQ